MAFISDAEFARRYGNVAPPSSAFVSDEEMLRRYGSVAEQARARLASRGLTPEAIKANPDVAITSPDEFTVDNSKRPGLLDYLAAAGQSALGMIPTEAPTAVNMPGMAFNMAADFAQRSVQADADFADDPMRRRIQKTAAAVPFVGGTIHDLLQPSFVAVDREPTPDERLAAMGAAVEAGALAAPAAMKGSLAKGAGVASRAEAAYADALRTSDVPLTESLVQKMMERKVVVNDPKRLETRARAAARNAELERDAIAAPKTSELGDPAAVARGAQRRTLAQEQKFQADMQALAEGLQRSEARTVGNVLLGGVKTYAKGLGLDAISAIPGAGMVALPSSVMKSLAVGKTLLYDLPKTHAFKTAKAIAKREFGKAMSLGDEALAAEVGAAIATGAAAADDFGHRSAIQSLAKEAEAAGSPELRRQVVASKRGFYTDPDGRSIEIPRNVMSALLDAKEVNETNSPVALWLGAMKKQGRVKGGGSLSFGDKPQPFEARSEGAGSVRNPATEWPSAGALDENDAMFTERGGTYPRPVPPSALLPDHMVNAKRLWYSSPASGVIPGPAGSVIHGVYGREFDPEKEKERRDYRADTITTSKEAIGTPGIPAHEVGHAVYEKDLAPPTRARFGQMYESAERTINATVNGAAARELGAAKSLPDQIAIIQKYAPSVPRAVLYYYARHGGVPEQAKHEAFAELFAQYMLNPTSFQRSYPDFYDYYKSDVFRGREYKRQLGEKE